MNWLIELYYNVLFVWIVLSEVQKCTSKDILINWLFEDTFELILLDWDGCLIWLIDWDGCLIWLIDCYLISYWFGYDFSSTGFPALTISSNNSCADWFGYLNWYWLNVIWFDWIGYSIELVIWFGWLNWLLNWWLIAIWIGC